MAAAPAPSWAQDYRSPLILSPYSIFFDQAEVGKESLPQTVTILNKGTAPVHITMVQAAGNFSEMNHCPTPPASLGLNETCQIDVKFKPPEAGACAGTLTISHDAGGRPLVVSLTGTGVLGGSEASVSPSSLDFGQEKIGMRSAPQTITLSDTGKKPLLISNIEAGGDFTIMPDSTCESRLNKALNANASCTIVVTFTPLGTGKREGQVKITDDAEDSPQIVRLSGTGGP